VVFWVVGEDAQERELIGDFLLFIFFACTKKTNQKKVQPKRTLPALIFCKHRWQAVASAALRAFAHRCKQNIIHSSSASRFGIADAHALFRRTGGFVAVIWALHWVGFVRAKIEIIFENEVVRGNFLFEFYLG